MSEIARVWQSIGEQLIEHLVIVDSDVTACGQRPWSVNTDPSTDPNGLNDELVWYADHDLPAEQIIKCRICQP